MAVSRNFRTTYYKTLGVPVVQHIVDVEASFHALFAEPTINTTQLTKLALEIGIAPTYRALTWKVLCGVLPVHTCVWEMAQHERQVMYDDLVEACLVLQLPYKKEEYRPAMAASVGNPSETRETQQTHKLVALYHTYRHDIMRATPLQRAHTDTCTNGAGGDTWMDSEWLVHVAALVERVFVENDVDQFWCLVRLVEILDDAHGLIEPALVWDALYDLSVTDFELLFVRALDCLRSITGRAV